MKKITYVSTRHQELGNCNSDELCKIISSISPEVIFLEAFDGTYSDYSQQLFKNFGVYDDKLEIQALQKYNHQKSFEYIPVLNQEMSEGFDKKYSVVCENLEFQKLLMEYHFIVEKYGFKFLNSRFCIELQDKMRKLEEDLLISTDLNAKLDYTIDFYENEMLRNIYSYCENKDFKNAVFMCGAGHRKSIIEKTINNRSKSNFDIEWTILDFAVDLYF